MFVNGGIVNQPEINELEVTIFLRRAKVALMPLAGPQRLCISQPMAHFIFFPHDVVEWVECLLDCDDLCGWRNSRSAGFRKPPSSSEIELAELLAVLSGRESSLL